MKERPILFSAPMVRALLAGTKTQTRRVLRDQQPIDLGAAMHGMHLSRRPVHDKVTQAVGHRLVPVFCPYGQPGDRLWVRESGWQRPERTPRMMREGADTWPRFAYAADDWSEQDRDDFKAWGFKPRPSIHMPRVASRILLEITDVRVERLQDISEADALAEGVSPDMGVKWQFGELWESINGPDSWDANPWVWVVEFKRVTP